MNMQDFLVEWFGVDGRELGVPNRFFTDNPSTLIKHIEEGRRRGFPVYVSVQPYRGLDRPCALEKLYFDFDCEEDPSRAKEDAKVFAEVLKRYYHVEPLTLFSGRKGYHVYVFLEKTVYFEEANMVFAKQVYMELQRRLLMGLKLPTLDPQPVGDIKRLARSPFSFHEKTGNMCAPVDENGETFTPESLDMYRTLNLSFLSSVVKELKAREKLSPLKLSAKLKPSKGVRPCIAAALERRLEGGAGHGMRLAIACELLNKGYTVDEIVPLFRNQPDFSVEKTRYFVEDAKKRGYKPFKCSTIRELGFCLPNCKEAKKHG